MSESATFTSTTYHRSSINRNGFISTNVTHAGHVVKLMVSGKLDALDEYQIRTKFQEYGDVLDVVVEDACAFISIVDNEVVQQLLNMKEITIFGTTKLNISRVLEEPVETPDGDLPFLPDPNPAVEENAEVSCPTYQLVYPYPYQTMWCYQETETNSYYNAPGTEFFPIYPQSCPSLVSHSFVFSPTPSSSNLAESSEFVNFFPNESAVPSSPSSSPHLDIGCHVCSTSSLFDISQLQAALYKPPGPVYNYNQYDNQLRPMTPITPSVCAGPGYGYLNPTNQTSPNPSLPQMAPTYYLPPSPVSSFTMINNGGDQILVEPFNSSIPPPSTYTKVKQPCDLPTPEVPSVKQSSPVAVAYFTSPFKRFTKFNGTPSRPQFPLKLAPAPHHYQGRGGRGGQDTCGWYQQGARWGQMVHNAKKNESRVQERDVVSDSDCAVTTGMNNLSE